MFHFHKTMIMLRKTEYIAVYIPQLKFYKNICEKLEGKA